MVKAFIAHLNTFLVSRVRGHVGILGMLLDVEVDVVHLHIEADGCGRITVHSRLEAAD